MATERPVSTPTGEATLTTEDKQIANARAAKFAEKFKPLTEEQKSSMVARFAQVMDRGYLNDRFNSISAKIPEGWHGQFFRNDPTEIERAKLLEYDIGHPSELGEIEGLPHGVGDSYIVGDTILMICRNEIHELHELARKKRYDDQYNSTRLKSKAMVEAVHKMAPEETELDVSEKTVITAENINQELGKTG